MAEIWSLDNPECRGGCGAQGLSIIAGKWERVQPLAKALGRLLIKPNTLTPHDPAIERLHVYPKTYVHTKSACNYL